MTKTHDKALYKYEGDITWEVSRHQTKPISQAETGGFLPSAFNSNAYDYGHALYDVALISKPVLDKTKKKQFMRIPPPTKILPYPTPHPHPNPYRSMSIQENTTIVLDV